LLVESYLDGKYVQAAGALSLAPRFNRTKLRDEVLRALNTPILFVQGTRDPLCPLGLLEQVRAEMKAPNFLHIVEGGDHSLRVPKRQLELKSKTQEDIDQQILRAIAGFVDQLPMSAD
jgi:predicted alpha/beta-hydrolase family hydrolase